MTSSLFRRRILAKLDLPLLAISIFIPVCGLIVLYSAGFDHEREVTSSFLFEWLQYSPAFQKQGVFYLLALAAMAAGAFIPPAFLQRCAYPLYIICVFLLIVVDVQGSIVKGSQRWLTLGFFNLQPAEPTKLAVILVMARFISRHPPPVGGFGFWQLLTTASLFGVPAALILGQPDLGTACVVFAIGGMMLLFAGVRGRVLLMVTLPVLLAIYPAWQMLHDYQKRRIQVLLDPDIDPKGSGYHITQSKIAVGSGGFFGKGYLRGTQTQLEFLPEHTTDFIFSVLSEEWGFVGAIFVLGLYVFLLYRLLRVVGRSRDLFQSFVALGVTAMIFFHFAVNVGMVIGLMPVVGIPLPLFSYGGSSLLSLMFAIGIVIGISSRRAWT